MATITLSDQVPEEVDGPVRFSLANLEFELESGKDFDTSGREDEYELLSAAGVHPWLVVEGSYEEPAVVESPSQPSNEQTTPPVPEGISAPVEVQTTTDNNWSAK